jgi:hypothetical protein
MYHQIIKSIERIGLPNFSEKQQLKKVDGINHGTQEIDNFVSRNHNNPNCAIISNV